MEINLVLCMFKRVVSLFLAVLIAVALIGSVIPVWAEPEGDITAEAVILVDAKSGLVLFEKNPDKKMFPASTTKIMTAMVVLEAVDKGEVTLEQEYTMTQEIFDTLALDGSSIYLEVGETMPLGDLLKGLLVASGNDAAALMADGLAGSIDAFVERMNAKAAELGLVNTHFVNPHGLHDENHYTTARELSIMAREAMKNETFRSIVESAHVYLEVTNMTPERRYYINTNNLVSRMRYPYYFYEYATGIKTGSTTEAGSCLVSSAEKDGRSVISVVLNSEDNSTSHNESKAILEHGLEDFALQKLARRDDIFGEVKVKQAAGDTDHLILSAEENVEVLFPEDGNIEEIEKIVEIPKSVRAPISSGQVIGKVSFVHKGQTLGEVKLISTQEVERSFFGPVMSFFEWLWSFAAVRIIVWILLILVVGFVLLLVIGFIRALKRSKRKQRRSNGYRPPRY